MKNSWAIAFGMMLLLEGIIPFFFPKQWHQTFNRITQFSDGQIRFFGLIALLSGLAPLGLIHFFF